MSDFIKSDYCTECDGEGFKMVGKTQYAIKTPEQCEQCERLHELEMRADRMHDEAKGN